jgi:predicted N-acyltransferase
MGSDGTKDDDSGNGSGADPAWTLRLHSDPTVLSASAWNALLAASPQPTPFLRHEFLAALHRSGSATPATGWSPVFATLEAGGQIHAAAALYLKSHSYGEYVFDWAWADAWQRAGQRYYPKLLGAVPFTPVPGSRLLARSDAARAALLQGIEQFARERGLSSAHLLFLDEADQAAAQAQGWLLREGVQFHWENRHVRQDATASALPYADFADFLASLNRDKRKKIQQERRYVREAGVSFEALQGTQISAADWDYFYECYVLTYQEHRSTPYLSRSFFAEVARTLPEHWLLFIARRNGQRVASSLVALDPQQKVAYGRYWGSTEYIAHLHFAACYFEPLDWCVQHQYRRFEGGAQGEHKMARGLLPVKTTSAHWLRHAGFADAVAQFLDQEKAGIGEYMDVLEARSPFRNDSH